MHTEIPPSNPVGHYENFPVASWLCPAQLRAPITAIYHFARTADDLADEGNASTETRLEQLHEYRDCLYQASRGSDMSKLPWAKIFVPLQFHLQQSKLPVEHLNDLLSAFVQDVHKTALSEGYANRRELLAYCRQSANPVGRLLLHLYQIYDENSLKQSDAICTSLQLINFWQDLSIDIPRKRWYLTEEDCSRHHVSPKMQQDAITSGQSNSQLTALLQDNIHWARNLMHEGLPLALRMPGRAGWELRLVVQGGLHILRKIENMQYQSFHKRPYIQKLDYLTLFMRALSMKK